MFLEKMYTMLRSKILKKKIPNIINVATNNTFNAQINEAKNKTPSIINLATNAFLDAKINQVKGEIPCVTNLATIAALTTVENKVPNVSNLVKKSRLCCRNKGY